MSANSINHDTTKANSLIVLVSIVATIIALVVVFISVFYFYKSLLSISQNKLQDTAKRHPYITDIENKAQSELQSLKWIDKSAGKVQVNIDIAKSKVVKDYN